MDVERQESTAPDSYQPVLCVNDLEDVSGRLSALSSPALGASGAGHTQR